MINLFWIDTAIVPMILAFATTSIATPICIFILSKLGVVDDPKKQNHPAKIHKIPIPRGGGIPLLIGVFAATFLIIHTSRELGLILFSSFIALLVGIADDKLDLSPYFRFLMNIVCALIVLAAGVSIPFITNPLGGILFLNQYHVSLGFITINLAQVVAGFWIVWVMNMLNWSKGVDGQMPGVVAISAIVIGILSLRFSVLDSSAIMSANLSFIIAGAALGFLLYNFHPAKIFPGYGATSIYLLLAVVSILSSAKLATAILVMGVPLADGGFTIFRRVISGKSPFWHDKKHFHHLLLSIGFGQRRIALFYWIISAIFGSLSLILSSKEKVFAIIMVIILVGGGLLFLNFALKKKDDKANL